ncbi:MAG: hypothetical protein PWQ93_1423 [Clostridiales bacterium]|jgi:hypothetical protein|nr:hypothetical protein [Clostridiales bacterium]
MDERIEQWKQQYGEVYAVTPDQEDDEKIVTFYFKKPKRQHIAKFAKDIMNDAYKAMYNLISECVIYPDIEAVNSMFEEKPGLVIAIGGELQKIIGTNQNFTTKKL